MKCFVGKENNLQNIIKMNLLVVIDQEMADKVAVFEKGLGLEIGEGWGQVGGHVGGAGKI